MLASGCLYGARWAGACALAAFLALVFTEPGLADPSAPILDAPADTAVISPNEHFLVSGVVDGGESQVQIAVEDEFEADIACDTDWFGNGFYSTVWWQHPGPIGFSQAMCLLAPGVYFWRARTRDEFGVDSTWSAVSSFELVDATPPPSDPPGGPDDTPDGDPGYRGRTHKFGGWDITEGSTGSQIRGVRASIRRDTSFDPQNACFFLFRVVLEEYGTNDAVGLMQTGVG